MQKVQGRNVCNRVATHLARGQRFSAFLPSGTAFIAYYGGQNSLPTRLGLAHIHRMRVHLWMMRR